MASTNTDALRFKDKVAVVTGGCNGIVRGCVDVFVEHGGKVAVLDLDETVGNSLSNEGAGEIYFIRCDITDEEQLKNAFASTYIRFGRIDCVVNNAGTHPGISTIDNISTSRFRKIIDLLLVSQFVSCREALPYLRKTKGSIINITSMSGVTCQVYCSDYSAAKSGLAGLTRGLACEEAKYGVRVNAIAPGATRTSLLEKYIADSKDSEATRQSVNDNSIVNETDTCVDKQERIQNGTFSFCETTENLIKALVNMTTILQQQTHGKENQEGG